MKLLLAAATQGEITPLLQHLQGTEINDRPLHFRQYNTDLHLCITGVGMVATAYALTKALQQASYDFVLQAGVGGSFNTALSLGDICFITSEQFGDLGAEDHDRYIDIFDMKLLQPDAPPYKNGTLETPLLPVHEKIHLPKVKGLTVNTVSGNARTISMRKQQYGCEVESMEGAAFHYVCLQEQTPFAQVRAISNYVIPRDKSTWKMKEAVIALNKWLIDFIGAL